jgi:hypothetical protein
MLLEAGKATFRNGAWSLSEPEFLVFDGVFIAENVFAGDVVGLEQRRNLYRVIVGKEGVGLAVEEERLAAESYAAILQNRGHQRQRGGLERLGKSTAHATPALRPPPAEQIDRR